MPAGQPTPAEADQGRLQLETRNRDLGLEISQLQDTVQALRDQLEHHAVDANQAWMQREAELQLNQQQLQDTINALRSELEAAAASHRAELQRREAGHASQLQELRETLVAQRAVLDSLHSERQI
ncbi:MAG: hypothetical protein ACKOFN_11960 [Vulcanococcus sp.]